MQPITPNRMLVYSAFLIVAFWIGAEAFPIQIVRDITNSFRFGVAFVICFTWFRAAVRAVRENVDRGELQLIFAVFLTWATVLAQGCYSIAFNFYGRPESWLESPWSALFSYLFTIAGVFFIAAPEARGDHFTVRGTWFLFGSIFIGGTLAGALLTLQIATD
jgi:hypothetical protein